MKSFGTTEYSGPMDPAKAQEQFIDKLSEAIASAVQAYLTQYVKTNPGTGSLITAPAFGPVAHVHPQLPHGITAP